MSERTWSVTDIGRRIEQVVAEHMAKTFWVRGEVADLGRSSRGMAFLTLVETDDTGRILARLPATMSPGKARLVDRRMERVGQPLADGLEVRVKGQLDYYAPGGRLSLSLSDIDPAHTAGAMAVARRDLLAALEAEGLAGRQRALAVPRLPLRVGLITRGGSQAYGDLTDELAASGLAFEVMLATSSVQGVNAPDELVAALQRVSRAGVDLVLLTRGGGAETDLATFDDPRVARAVAMSPVPVWTGIGHHLDQPVTELIAQRAFKTPTALAQGVVAHVQRTVGETEATWTAIRTQGQATLATARRRLARAGARTQVARTALGRQSSRLDAVQRRAAQAGVVALRAHVDALDLAEHDALHHARRVLLSASTRLDAAADLTAAHDPARLLARGWTVTTTDDGRPVLAPLPAGTALVTTTAGGAMRSTVTATTTVTDDE